MCSGFGRRADALPHRATGIEHRFALGADAGENAPAITVKSPKLHGEPPRGRSRLLQGVNERFQVIELPGTIFVSEQSRPG